MLLVALERATQREVDFRQRLLLCRFFRQRAGKMTWTEGRLEAMFFPHPELRSARGAIESIERARVEGRVSEKIRHRVDNVVQLFLFRAVKLIPQGMYYSSTNIILILQYYSNNSNIIVACWIKSRMKIPP